MKEELQRIAIAEACGWKRAKTTPAEFKESRVHDIWVTPSGKRHIHGISGPPDYLGSLDAMHEAEKVLSEVDYNRYELALSEMFAVFKHDFPYREASATAAQRAEAFLRTLSLWAPSREESPHTPTPWIPFQWRARNGKLQRGWKNTVTGELSTKDPTHWQPLPNPPAPSQP